MSEQNGVKEAMAYAQMLDDQTKDIRDVCGVMTLRLLTLASEVTRLAALTPKVWSREDVKKNDHDQRYFALEEGSASWTSTPYTLGYLLGLSRQPIVKFYGPIILPTPPQQD